MTGAGGYWLEDWVDEFDIASRQDFARAIKSPTVVKSLYDSIADTEKLKPQGHQVDFPLYSVLAGRHLDLSGSYRHPCMNCLSEELSMTMAQTMHFFERVVVSGPRVSLLAWALQQKDTATRKEALQALWPFIDFLLYVTRIGARERLIFAPKTEHYCEECLRVAARQFGVAALESDEQSQVILDKLLSESKFVVMRDRTGQWKASVNHPYLGMPYYKNTSGRRRPTRKEVVSGLFRSLSESAVHDLSASRHYGLPLFEGFTASWLDDARNSPDDGAVRADDIALHLEVPTLVGLPLERLVELHQQNQEGIVRMQRAIAAAIRESMGRRESDSPKRIAEAVTKDFIEPELASIENRLKSKQRSLGKKLSAAAALATTTTSVGLIIAVPLVIATGVGVAATSLAQLYKYFDDKSEVETSDLYFLSKLQRIRH